MIFHILTAVLVILKALGYVTWSWWLVLAPSIFAVILGIALITGLLSFSYWLEK